MGQALNFDTIQHSSVAITARSFHSFAAEDMRGSYYHLRVFRIDAIVQ